MLNGAPSSAEDLAAREAARRIVVQRFGHLGSERLSELMAQVDLLAAAGLARHSDGRLDAAALAEAARLAVIVSTSRAAERSAV